MGVPNLARDRPGSGDRRRPDGLRAIAPLRVLISISLLFLIGAGCSEPQAPTDAAAPPPRQFVCGSFANGVDSEPSPGVATELHVVQARRHLARFVDRVAATHDPSELASLIAPRESAEGLGRQAWLHVLSTMSNEEVLFYLDALACDIATAVPIQLNEQDRLILFQVQMSLPSGARAPRQLWFSYADDNTGLLPPR